LPSASLLRILLLLLQYLLEPRPDVRLVAFIAHAMGKTRLRVPGKILPDLPPVVVVVPDFLTAAADGKEALKGLYPLRRLVAPRFLSWPPPR
jgi:hypothetical protein